ncbi:hypothetical protein PM082_003713 [Marasmius tenuissimus]|nr:hypothetical protein PM082_003713 [Marasmius tenuissimus]
MVRTSHDELEDKKDAARKRSSSTKTMKKAPATNGTGIWPCKMNGCTKQFAREADLKRHQRTTKLHSMPSFACPQCDATFTRTDALRRHQKSRHNGVAEPMEVPKEAEETGQSSSRSSSTAPSSKGKERENSTVPMVPMTEPAGGASTSSLATPVTSYYRQHTANNSNYAPPRPAHYAQVTLPTSAARGDSKGWMHPNPWPDGSGGSSTGQMQYMYIASPYYRSNVPMAPPPLLTPVSQTPGPAAFNSSPHSDHSDDYKMTAHSPASSSSSLMADMETNDVAPEPYPTRNLSHTSNIDPSLSQDIDPSLSHPNTSTHNFDQILSKAGMDAFSNEDQVDDGQRPEEGHDLAGQEKEGAGPWSEPSKAREPSGFTEPHDSAVPYIPAEEEENPRRGTLPFSLAYDPQADPPEPMEHMLTEDGEPMLNPAELLTQESLASPEPS